MDKLKNWGIISLLVFSLVSLGGCNRKLMKIRNSKDVSLQYDYAKKFYNIGKYKNAAELLTDVLPHYSGTVEGSRVLFMLARSEYEIKAYETASEYFVKYYTEYPKGEEIEEARFYAGASLYKGMPEARLDQSTTYSAIQELQVFSELYPQSKHREEVNRMLFDLQDNLALKELKNAQMYYDLGIYLGNNYRASIVTINNALRDYPYSKYREDFYFLLLQATYKEAVNSVPEKQQERYRDVEDKYFLYINEFPEGKHLAKVKSIYSSISTKIAN